MANEWTIICQETISIMQLMNDPSSFKWNIIFQVANGWNIVCQQTISYMANAWTTLFQMNHQLSSG